MIPARHVVSCRLALIALALGFAGMASAQQIDARFSCSAEGEDAGERVIYADTGVVRLDGAQIGTFRWESSLFRSTHGFDCSIDEEDGLKAEAIGDDKQPAWRVSLVDPIDARARRGYDFAMRTNCTIRIIRNGDAMQIKPSCPALCGSRPNFSELSVNLKTGACRYEH